MVTLALALMVFHVRASFVRPSIHAERYHYTDIDIMSRNMNLLDPSGTNVNKLAWELIDKAESVGQIGAKALESDQVEIAALAEKLASKSRTRNIARIKLSGAHQLMYSTSPGGSSGAIGPFVGKVTQRFVNDENFINAVELGPLNIELNAVRSVLDGLRIKVKFEETVVKFFGVEVSRSSTKGQGIWKHIFVGEVQRGNDRRLLRVMETPSLFIIQQKL